MHERSTTSTQRQQQVSMKVQITFLARYESSGSTNNSSESVELLFFTVSEPQLRIYWADIAIQTELEKVEYFLTEYASHLNDIEFDMKLLDLDENYSHVISSSDYTPKISVQDKNGDDDEPDDGLENDNDEVIETDNDDGGGYQKISVTPRKQQPQRGAK